MDGNVIVFCDLVFRKGEFSSLKAQHLSLSDMLHLFRMTVVVFKFVRLESQVQYAGNSGGSNRRAAHVATLVTSN